MLLMHAAAQVILRGTTPSTEPSQVALKTQKYTSSSTCNTEEKFISINKAHQLCHSFNFFDPEKEDCTLSPLNTQAAFSLRKSNSFEGKFFQQGFSLILNECQKQEIF